MTEKDAGSDDLVHIDDGAPKSNLPATQVPEGTLILRSLNELPDLVDSLEDLISTHRHDSRKRFRSTLFAIVAVLLIAAGGLLYQRLVVGPQVEATLKALAATQAQLAEAQKSLDDSQALARVLMDSLAENNRALSKTMDKKLTALGFTGTKK